MTNYQLTIKKLVKAFQKAMLFFTNRIKIENCIILFLIVFGFFIFPSNTFAIGTFIDDAFENKAKVCRDISCEEITPGIIDFNKNKGIPLIIDKENKIIGNIWGGNDLGWVSMNPPYGGVYIADTETGLLKGTAWSEFSGAINFSVTGQEVIVDKNTGELSGWAWASGPYGGWIKFNCQESSCIHSTWRNLPPISPRSDLGENLQGDSLENPRDALGETSVRESLTENDLGFIEKIKLVGSNISKSFINFNQNIINWVNNPKTILDNLNSYGNKMKRILLAGIDMVGSYFYNLYHKYDNVIN